jgi:hypothetical protein
VSPQCPTAGNLPAPSGDRPAPSRSPTGGLQGARGVHGGRWRRSHVGTVSEIFVETARSPPLAANPRRHSRRNARTTSAAPIRKAIRPIPPQPTQPPRPHAVPEDGSDHTRKARPTQAAPNSTNPRRRRMLMRAKKTAPETGRDNPMASSTTPKEQRPWTLKRSFAHST